MGLTFKDTIVPNQTVTHTTIITAKVDKKRTAFAAQKARETGNPEKMPATAVTAAIKAIEAVAKNS